MRCVAYRINETWLWLCRTRCFFLYPELILAASFRSEKNQPTTLTIIFSFSRYYYLLSLNIVNYFYLALPYRKMDIMEIDTPIPNSVQIIMPNGSKKELNGPQTVRDVIKNCGINDGDLENYALVFFGRKLQLDQRLEGIQHLNSIRPIRLVRQRSSPKTVHTKEEINKLLIDCRLKYKALIEDAYPPQISGEAYQALLIYIVENHAEQYKNAIKEYPNLPFDQLGQDIIRDWRLLIPYLMENDEFAHEHPHCLQIFKKALETISAKYSPNSPFIRYAAPGFAGPSHGGQHQPVITQNQLSQALALALGGNPPATPSPPAEIQPPALAQQQNEPEMFDNNAQNFSAQLQQMHEFGFMDDGENIQALMLTNGDVEQALQIVIAMRE